MDDEEEEYPNKETEKLFGGVENGDEEVVKVLLLGNKNKQFELDINFQFKIKRVFFLTPISLSFFFSLSLFLLIVKWLCDIYFCFCSFFNNFLFVKEWRDRSSHSCFQRF